MKQTTAYDILLNEYIAYDTCYAFMNRVIDIIKIEKNIICEYDRWVVETRLCKLRVT